jgi:hypothetical protein
MQMRLKFAGEPAWRWFQPAQTEAEKLLQQPLNNARQYSAGS